MEALGAVLFSDDNLNNTAMSFSKGILSPLFRILTGNEMEISFQGMSEDHRIVVSYG